MYILIVTLFLGAILLKFFLRTNYWKKRGVNYEPAIPILGSLWKTTLQKEHVVFSLQKIYEKNYNKQCVGYHFFNTPILLVKDPKLIKAITIKDFDHFVDHNGMFINEDVDPLFKRNLFSLKGKRWHELRAATSPAFTGSKMKFMFSLISECGKQVANYLKDEIIKTGTNNPMDVDMKDILSRYTMDVIATAAFGVKVDSLKDKENEFYMMGKNATNFKMWKFLLTSVAPWALKFFNSGIIPKPVEKFVRRIIHENIEARERDGIVRPDLIHILMQARKGASDNEIDDSELDKLYGMNTADNKISRKIDLTEEDIAGQAFVFFVAGFDAAATSLCFAAYELALNPEVQRHLQDEIDGIIDEKLIYQSMQQLKYMDMVIAETFRKWPQTAFIDRMCTKPYTLKTDEGDINLEPGMVINIPVRGLHHDPKYFPHPEKFDPERFSDENKNSIEQCTYLPFGSGPRICIGQRFALMETKVALYYLLKNFDIVPVDKTQIPLKLSPKTHTMVTEKGFHLGLKLRKINK